MTKGEKGDYIIRLLDPTKIRCIFCLNDNKCVGVGEDDLTVCCDSFDKQAPLCFSAKHKAFWIYVDWVNINKCNVSFCYNIEVDSVSKNV